MNAWTWGNSSSTNTNTYARGIDLDGRVTSYPLGNAMSNGTNRTISYDAASRITAISHSGTGTGNSAPANFNQSYGYDNLDRLNSVTGSSSTNTQSFQYDQNGNRTQGTFGTGGYTNTIAVNSNQLTATTGPAPAKSNTYDAAGNLTGDGTISYTYSDRGRMVSATNAGNTVTYTHNGIGQRVQKQGPASIIATGSNSYVYDGAGHLIGEYDANQQAIEETVYLGDLPVSVLKQTVTGTGTSQATATNVYYVYADHINTPRVITQVTDNQMVWRWDNTDPFGLQPPDENPSSLGVFTYNQRFPGQLYDKETNNFYNINRDYDPQQGRYVQSDPIGLGGGTNTYGYVSGNPIAFFDSMGLQQGYQGDSSSGPTPIGIPDVSAAAQRDVARRIANAIRDANSKTYQTYTRFNPSTGQCYRGRTSGYGSPEDNIRNRGAAQQHLNDEGFNPPVLDRSSESYFAIRGREQQLIDHNGGAQSSGGTSRNKINGVSPINVAGPLVYDPAATAEFGPIRSQPGSMCVCDK